MRYLLLSLLFAVSGLMSAQCAIDVTIEDVSCDPNTGLAVVRFDISATGGTAWFSPTLGIEGDYETDFIWTSPPFDLAASGGILFFDQQQQDSCVLFVPIDDPGCGLGGCADLSITIGPEGQFFCGFDQEQLWFISLNSGQFPVSATYFNGQGTPIETINFTQISSNPIFLNPGEVYQFVFTDAEGCTYSETIFTEVFDCGSVTGRSWFDENGNGLQDPEETTPIGATVTLHQGGPNAPALQTQVTDANGVYVFDGLESFVGYSISITPQDPDYELTLFNVSDNQEINSDFSPIINATGVFVANPGIQITQDAGWIINSCASLEAELIVSDVAPGSCELATYLLDISAGDFPYDVILIDSTEGEVVQEFTVAVPDDFVLFADNPGYYVVRISNAEGCVQFLDFEQLVTSGIEVNIVQQGDFCTGDGIQLVAEIDANPAEFSFAWSNGDTGQFTTVNQGGQYTVEVFNEAGCTGFGVVFVSQSSSDTIDVPQVVYLPCEGGVATVTIANPIDGVTYNWFGPENFFTTGITVELEATGFYEISGIGNNQSCFSFGFTQVVDANLGDLSIQYTSDNDSICGIGNCFGIIGIDGFNANTIAIDWTGPDGPLELSDFPIQGLCGYPEGTYTATVMTVCDTVELSFDNEILSCTELSGTLYLDADGDCGLDDNDIPASGFILTITDNISGAMYYAWTDPDGNWAIELPNGVYTIEPIIEDGQPLTTCPATTVTLNGSAVTGINIFMPVLESCPVLTTEITLPFLRRCFTGCAYVTYENTGTATGEDAQVTVTLDPFFINVVPSIDPVSVVGNVYTFNVGDLPPFSNGTIGFIFTISCDAELGQAHCIEATITPDDVCSTDPAWGGALVDITEAVCDGDSIIFTVTNIGENPMTIPLSYVIVEDGIMLSAEPFVNGLLEPGENFPIAVAADGATVSLMTNQEPNAPGADEPSVVFEGCNGDGQNFSTGFSNLLPLASGNPASSFVCRENVGSYDPNDKMGYPLGWDGGNIEEGTSLDYEIRFQNTGTDTAFTVVISDTIAPELDLATFKMASASHPYTVTIDTHRVVTWTFDNILLPDSSTNLLLSQGSVVFSIDHDESLVPGDEIFNEAAIYFDFNEPIITNRSRHVIAKDGLPTSLRIVTQHAVNLEVFPNPVSDILRLRVPAEDARDSDMVNVLDVHGRVVLSRPYTQTGQGIDVSKLPAGYYVLVLDDEGGIARGRTPFIVASR